MRTTVYSRSRLELMLDSDPLEYARMILDGAMQAYIDRIDDLCHGQEKTISKQIQEKMGCSEGMAESLARETLLYS